MDLNTVTCVSHNVLCEGIRNYTPASNEVRCTIRCILKYEPLSTTFSTLYTCHAIDHFA